jgi:hypothetical protein
VIGEVRHERLDRGYRVVDVAVDHRLHANPPGNWALLRS